MTDDEILLHARTILRGRKLRKGSTTFTKPEDSRKFLAIELAIDKNEVFCVAFLDNRHRLLIFERMFYGTVNGASVYPRPIVQRALECNAAAVVLAHNHPSGVAEPSQVDRAITKRLQEALQLIDVTLLDHIIIGDDTISFAERGWI